MSQVEYVINGTWDSKLEGSPVIAETVVKGKSSLEIGPTKTLWKVREIWYFENWGHQF